MTGFPVAAYECVQCPREGFHYTPGACRMCDKPLQPMGAAQMPRCVCGKSPALTSRGVFRPHAVPIDKRVGDRYEKCPGSGQAPGGVA